MKRNYAKTYLKIFIAILIIIFIALGVVYFLNNEYDNEKIENIKIDMLLIQAKTKIISEKVNIKEKDAKYIGKNALDMTDNEQIALLQEKGIIDLNSKENTYYVLEKQDIENLNIQIETEVDFYIVDYKTNEIFIPNGVIDKSGNVLYKLSDIKNIK